MEALQDGDLRVRSSAAYSLGRVGPAARPAIPLLLKASKNGLRQVRLSADYALRQIGTEEQSQSDGT